MTMRRSENHHGVERTSDGKLVPFRAISETEWSAVPKSVPQVYLTVGVWLPLLALMGYLIKLAPQPLRVEDWGDILTFSFFVGTIAVIWAADRLAPWIAGGLTGWLYYLISPTGIEQYVMFVALGYFVILGLVGLIGQLRFMNLLKSWRANASGTVDLAGQANPRLGIRAQLPATLWSMVLSSVAIPLAKLIWQYLTSAKQDFAALDLEKIHEAGTGMIAVLLCLILASFKWVEKRFVGETALEIPIASQSGPLSYKAIGVALPLGASLPEECICAEDRANHKQDEFNYAEYLIVLDQCPVHGIQAVNSLSARQFMDIADQPWVYGKNINQRLVPAGKRMVVVGLYGWGAHPLRVTVPYSLRSTRLADESLLPGRAREPLRRDRRKITWVNPKDSEQINQDFDAKTMTVIDQLNLMPMGLNTYAVRVRDHRPFLIDFQPSTTTAVPGTVARH